MGTVVKCAEYYHGLSLNGFERKYSFIRYFCCRRMSVWYSCMSGWLSMCETDTVV